MNASEVLYKAADYIEQYGLHKGSWWAETAVPNPPCCARGALVWVLLTEMSEQDAVDASTFARDALEERVGPLHVWNDAPERTQEEVVATLRAVAAEEAEKEKAL